MDTIKRLSRYVVVVSVLMASSISSGCDKAETAASEIRIGVIAMLSGENAVNGQNMTDAARLAVEQMNKRGLPRIGDKTVRVTLIIEDDPGSPEGALDAARKLIYRDEVAALVGPQFSSQAIPVARLAEAEGVVMVCPMSTHPETTAGKSYVFRIPYLDTFQGAVLSRFARESLEAATAAVLYDIAGVYNRTLAEVFKERFEAAGGKVTGFEQYTTDHTGDFSEQLARIAGCDPDVLLLPNYAADALLQARQARAAGITAVLLGGDGWDQESFAGEPAFEGSFTTRHWHPDIADEGAQEFIASFRRTFDRVPEDVAATTFDAVSLLLVAIHEGGSVAADAIRDQLYSLGLFAGVTGTIRYADCGDPIKGAVVARISDGRASFYTLIEP